MTPAAARVTPMMRQYRGIKEQNPDAILFFRMGDFYEMFYEDAETAARVLNLTLTTRDKNSESAAPMAGVPWHAADRYIARLIKAGYRVVVCDQVGDASASKGLVERAVTEIVTPGTAMAEGLLSAKENNYLAALASSKGRVGLALGDVSTGEFGVDEFDAAELAERLDQYRPREILVSEDAALDIGTDRLMTRRPGWHFTPAEGDETLRRHFGVASLDGLGLGPLGPALGAAGALMRYLKEVRNAELSHITGIQPLESASRMILDDATRRHLEVFKPAFEDGPDTSLIGVIDRTVTSAGGRRLRSWLDQPLLEPAEVEARLDAVEELTNRAELRDDLGERLNRTHDLERLLGRAACGKSGPRDLKAIGETSLLTGELAGVAAGAEAGLLRKLSEEIHDLSDLGETLTGAIIDDPPVLAADGGIFRDGYDAELDELRRGTLTGKQWIAALQDRERKRTGIPTLKVGYNKVFGYYLEVTHAHQGSVPEDYIRKQTLVNAERYITPDLKEEESRVLGAEERIRKLESQLFARLRETVVARASEIRETASALARLDVFLGLARAAREHEYIRPGITATPILEITGGRHPVVERLLPSGHFVPNDLEMDAAGKQLLILTGPNMAGKSTYLRQTALLVLMAQIGSFVPAASATVGIVDRIFTRIGAADSIARGRSTFMVEMQETAAILRNATDRSLVILDEVGRGTSTFDGLSIAWAVTEYLHGGSGGHPRTLFATHYHELTHLVHELPRVVNLNVLVKEWNDEVRFLHQIVPGAADRSYGIQVARLAGLPEAVLVRAREVLTHLEAGRFDQVERPESGLPDPQMDLFDPVAEEWRADLEGLNVDQMTPVQALSALDRLKRKYASEKPGDASKH